MSNHLNISSFYNLNRLTTGVRFDANGNITWKAGVGDFFYCPVRVHAVERIYGYLDGRFSQLVDHTSFQKICRISILSGRTPLYASFVYGPTRQRREMTVVFGNNTLIRHYTQNVDISSIRDDEGRIITTETKEYIFSPFGLVAIRNNGIVNAVATDHLGSIVAEFNLQRNTFEYFGYTAWGRRYLYENDQKRFFDEKFIKSHLLPLSFFQRGFTGHEHMDAFGLINMNGRMYDPVIGRFLSPDPFVPDATFTQDFNRYMYARNNPLSYIDPCGEFVTWSFNRNGFSIGFNLTPIGIPAGAGVNIGWSNGGSAGVYGELGWRVGGTGLGAGVTFSQSLDFGFQSRSWSTTSSFGAHASFAIFTAGGNASFLHGQHGGWNWGVNAGLGWGNDRWGVGLTVGYGSGGWSWGLGGFFSPEVHTTIVDRDLAFVEQIGDFNCGPAAGESASRGLVSQHELRRALGGDPNTTGVRGDLLWEEWSRRTGRRQRVVGGRVSRGDLLNALQHGYDISVSIHTGQRTADGSPLGHSVMLNRATRRSTTVFGVPVTRYTFHVMDPARGSHIRMPGGALTGGHNIFLLFPPHP